MALDSLRTESGDVDVETVNRLVAKIVRDRPGLRQARGGVGIGRGGAAEGSCKSTIGLSALLRGTHERARRRARASDRRLRIRAPEPPAVPPADASRRRGRHDHRKGATRADERAEAAPSTSTGAVRIEDPVRRLWARQQWH
jgi:hypothetical protein